MGRLIEVLEQEISKRKLHDRVMSALIDAALNLSVKNPTYKKQVDVTDQVAKLDLQGLVNAGLLEAKGERRWRHYIASEQLKAIRKATRSRADIADPFEQPAGLTATQLELSGLSGAS